MSRESLEVAADVEGEDLVAHLDDGATPAPTTGPAARARAAPDSGADAGSGTAPAGDSLLSVTVALTGRVNGSASAVVESMRTPLGDLGLFPALTLSDGRPGQDTLLRGRLACSVIRRGDPVDGTLLTGSVARVRPAGSRRTVEVPVVVVNPAVSLPAVEQRCLPPGQVPITAPFTVTVMTARTDGTVVLVVAPEPGPPDAATPNRPVRFGLVHYDEPSDPSPIVPLRADAVTSTFAVHDTAWTVTTSPPTPFVVTAPTTVRLRFAYTCPPPPRRGGAAGLSRLPGDVRAAGIRSDGGIAHDILGWDDQVFASAAFAAAAAACAATVPSR